MACPLVLESTSCSHANKEPCSHLRDAGKPQLNTPMSTMPSEACILMTSQPTALTPDNSLNFEPLRHWRNRVKIKWAMEAVPRVLPVGKALYCPTLVNQAGTGVGNAQLATIIPLQWQLSGLEFNI